MRPIASRVVEDDAVDPSHPPDQSHWHGEDPGGWTAIPEARTGSTTACVTNQCRRTRKRGMTRGSRWPAPRPLGVVEVMAYSRCRIPEKLFPDVLLSTPTRDADGLPHQYYKRTHAQDGCVTSDPIQDPQGCPITGERVMRRRNTPAGPSSPCLGSLHICTAEGLRGAPAKL